jgi:hypothetical protein
MWVLLLTVWLTVHVPASALVHVMVIPFMVIVLVLGIVFMGHSQHPPLIVHDPTAAVGGAVVIVVICSLNWYL